jgi:uracil-DNA glycosylase
VLVAHAQARILVVGQAPGTKVHRSGVPFDDASGDRLRQWLGLDRSLFYTPQLVAFLPMGFCYPGRGASGDLPPRSECAPAWRERLLAQLTRIELVLLVGQYAQAWHLGPRRRATLTETVRAWRDYWPAELPPTPARATTSGWRATHFEHGGAGAAAAIRSIVGHTPHPD